jgi:hypothetical protein
MKLKSSIKKKIILLARVAIFCGVFLCLACGSVNKIKSFFITDYNVCLETLNKGNDAFKKGDFNKAREIYEVLYQKSGDKTIARKALYGLACTHFILAKDSDDFDKAIALWNKWSNLVPSVMEEDPRMLAPLLQHKVKKWVTDEGSVKVMKLEAEKLKLLIQLKEQEIKTLKHQIKTLEEIDQKIHEKQQGISSN